MTIFRTFSACLLLISSMVGCTPSTVDKSKQNPTVSNYRQLHDGMVGKTVLQILKDYDVDHEAVYFMDDPPGKLRGLSFPISNPEGFAEIYFRHNPDNHLHTSFEADWKLEDFFEELIIEVEYQKVVGE